MQVCTIIYSLCNCPCFKYKSASTAQSTRAHKELNPIETQLDREWDIVVQKVMEARDWLDTNQAESLPINDNEQSKNRDEVISQVR